MDKCAGHQDLMIAQARTEERFRRIEDKLDTINERLVKKVACWEKHMDESYNFREMVLANTDFRKESRKYYFFMFTVLIGILIKLFI